VGGRALDIGALAAYSTAAVAAPAIIVAYLKIEIFGLCAGSVSKEYHRFLMFD
jgi:hypothetical protein